MSAAGCPCFLRPTKTSISWNRTQDRELIVQIDRAPSETAMDKLSQPDLAAVGQSRSTATTGKSPNSTQFGPASPSLLSGARDGAGRSSSGPISAASSAAASLSADAKD